MTEAAFELRDVPVGACLANEWNANKMDDETFVVLVEEIRTNGFLDPIEVVALEGEQYRIIGGEHRHKAAARLEMETIPARVLVGDRWDDGDLQKFRTMRANDQSVANGMFSRRQLRAMEPASSGQAKQPR